VKVDADPSTKDADEVARALGADIDNAGRRHLD